jgi:hypothetical protein
LEKHYRLKNSSIDFEFYPSGGPIDRKEGTEALFELLGRASAAWARMELMLDIILLHINKASESPEIYDPEHPVSFKRKLKLMKRWLKHPKLAPGRNIFRKSLAILKTLADTRNDVLHSHITSFDPQTGRIGFLSLRFLGDDNFQMQSGEYSVERLQALLEMATKSTLALTELADLVMPHGDSPSPQTA